MSCQHAKESDITALPVNSSDWVNLVEECNCSCKKYVYTEYQALFFLNFSLQIIKKSCIEILAAEPSSVCAGGKSHLNTRHVYVFVIIWK